VKGDSESVGTVRSPQNSKIGGVTFPEAWSSGLSADMKGCFAKSSAGGTRKPGAMKLNRGFLACT
jgi:hypothetical protein